jgi:hypothetical protein
VNQLSPLSRILLENWEEESTQIAFFTVLFLYLKYTPSIHVMIVMMLYLISLQFSCRYGPRALAIKDSLFLPGRDSIGNGNIVRLMMMSKALYGISLKITPHTQQQNHKHLKATVSH